MTRIFEPGTLLDAVELLEFITTGGQAEIWRVRDINFKKHGDLALKLRHVPWESRSDWAFRNVDDRMEYEANLLGECTSQHIVTPHFKIEGMASIDNDDYAYYGVVMDRAQEGSLDKFMSSKAFARLDEIKKLQILEELAMGLRDLQHYNIIHNDIKPHNILVFDEAKIYRPRYADFGYAFRKGEPVVRGGTPPYMAPELLIYGTEPNFKTDVFSLGILFYEMMNGEHPLSHLLNSDDVPLALKRHYSNDHISFEEFRTGMHDVVELLQQMCHREAANRPTIHRVVDALRKIIHAHPHFTTMNMAGIYPNTANAFRWPHSLHEKLGEKEVLIFMRGSDPDSDVDYLRESLSREEFYGFSIFRVFGTNDYILRVWRRKHDVATLETVLAHFIRDRSGQQFSVETVFHWPEPAATSRMFFKTEAEAFDAIATVVKSSEANTKMGIRSQPLLFGEAKWRRERDDSIGPQSSKSKRRNTKKKHAIRSICYIRAAKSLTNKLTEVIGERLFKEISGAEGLSEVEVCANPSGVDGHAEFVVIAESTDFHKFKQAIAIANVVMRELSLSNQSRFRTHFEMDDTSSVESYDGRLLYELHQFAGRRTDDD